MCLARFSLSTLFEFVDMARRGFLCDYMKTWVFCCQILGLFPYRVSSSGRNIVKSRCYVIHAIRCAILYIGNELYFSRYKYNFKFFGWIYETIALLFVVLWLVYWFRNNTHLIGIFSLFDQFDEKFELIFGREIRHKSLGWVPGVILLLVLYSVNFVTLLFIVQLNGYGVVMSFAYGLIRSLERSIFVLFTALYLFLVYCLEFRYRKLKLMWNDVVLGSLRNENFDSSVTVYVMEMRSLFSSLSNIVEALNACLGSRLVVLHGQLFNAILMYFYLMFSGFKLTVAVLPFYVIPPLCMSMVSQSLCSSAAMDSNLFELPLKKLPPTLLHQICSFAQQLRCCPIKIHASGFFTITPSFFFSMAFSLASYLVAIFQLAPLMNRISVKTGVTIL